MITEIVVRTALFVATSFCAYLLYHFFEKLNLAQKIEKALIRSKNFFM